MATTSETPSRCDDLTPPAQALKPAVDVTEPLTTEYSVCLCSVCLEYKLQLIDPKENDPFDALIIRRFNYRFILNGN